MSELPTGWTTVSLGEVAEFEMGQAPASSTCNTEGRGTVFVRAGEFGATYPLVREWTTHPLKFARDGDVLICVVGATCGKLNLAIDCAIGRSVAAIRPNEALGQKTLYRQLQLQVDRLRNDSTGTAQGVINKQMLADIPLVVPPTQEQTRIADQLDALLARVQACTERLDAVPALLKKIRKAVLHAATSGELTADWRSAHSSRPWRRVHVGDVLRGKPRNGYSPRAVDYKTPVRSLTLSATTSGVFDPRHIKYIDEEIPDTSHLWLCPGDILVQRANTLEYVGVSAVFTGPAHQFIYPDLMMKCQANDEVLTQFLYFALSAESTRTYLRDHATGTAGNMPKINQQTLMSAPIGLPSLEEQSEIVRRVEKLFTAVDFLTARHAQGKLHVARLNALLLAKAFRGELVPQDPNDEPASELLARIAAQRNQPQNPSKARKPRAPRAPQENHAMTKSRLDQDVMGQPYLASHLRRLGTSSTAEALFKVAELPVADFYKQLAWEVKHGHVKDRQSLLEPGDAA